MAIFTGTLCPTILDLMIRPEEIIEAYNGQPKDQIIAILASRSVNSRFAKSRPQLLKRLIKTHYQPVVYDGFTLRELRAFIKQRNLPSAVLSAQQKTHSRPAMVAHLEQADREATFPLQDLPTELRYEVYTHALTASIPLSKQSEPPLTRVSKQIRSECLPLFYRNNTFPIIIGVKRDKHRTWTTVDSEAIPSNFWLLSLDAQKLQHLRSFEFVFSRIHRCPCGRNHIVSRFRVDFNAAKSQVTVKDIHLDPFHVSDYTMLLLELNSIVPSRVLVLKNAPYSLEGLDLPMTLVGKFFLVGRVYHEMEQRNRLWTEDNEQEEEQNTGLAATVSQH